MTDVHDTWVYHQRIAPTGIIIRSTELAAHKKNGWVDTPAKFGQGIGGQYYSMLHWLASWSRQDWQWAIQLVVGVAVALLVGWWAAVK